MGPYFFAHSMHFPLRMSLRLKENRYPTRGRPLRPGGNLLRQRQFQENQKMAKMSPRRAVQAGLTKVAKLVAIKLVA